MIVEITQMKLVKGTNPQAFIKAAEKTQPFLQKQAGYVDRELLKIADDQWVDLVHWKTADDARRAGKAMMHDPSCADFVRMIDPAGVDMKFVEQVKVWKQTSSGHEIQNSVLGGNVIASGGDVAIRRGWVVERHKVFVPRRVALRAPFPTSVVSQR